MLVSAAVDVVSVVTPPYLHCKHFLGEGLPTAEVVSAVPVYFLLLPIYHSSPLYVCIHTHLHIYVQQVVLNISFPCDNNGRNVILWYSTLTFTTEQDVSLCLAHSHSHNTSEEE